ncbi:MAG: Ig-like domain-containing protein [Pirellulaceae bacterium]
MAGSGATYDGATLTVTDLDGNSIVLEFDDARLPGVGSTGGVDHIAVQFDDSDDMASMDAKIVDALNNPPAANVAGGGTWGVSAFIDAVTGEIRIVGEASAVANAGGDITALTNVFTSLAADETYDGATVTITDADGDTITFEFEDTTATAPAVAGITAGNSPILYDPAFTRNELSSAISDAINAPDATVLAGLTGTWDVVSFLPVTSDQMQLSSVDSLGISADAAPIINPLASESFSAETPLEARPAHDAVVRTFTIVVEAINDAPEFDLSENPINLLEDAGPQAIENFVINAAAGPPDAEDELASQSLTLTVTALDPSAFATLPTVVNFDPVAGTSDIEFELAPDVNNETGNDLTILVTLMDDGGTASGGVDTTVQTLTLSVTPVNDAPSFTLSETEVTVFEDDEDVTGDSPTTFVGFAVDPTQGPDTAVDETTLPATQQQLTFETVSVSAPSLFEVQPSISPSGDLSFVTADNQNGQAVVVVRLMDDGADGTTGNGDENTAVPDQTFTINITAVNDPPEFEIPTEVSSFEDQGLVQVANFATNLIPGPDSATDEAGQQFIVSVVAADPSAFTIQPEIAADGTLSYQTGPDVNSDNADLRVFVTLTDDGTPGPSPDNNTSETKTFLVNTDAINDAPTFNVDQAQVTVIEDVEQFEGTTITTVSGLISNPAPGPATAIDEISQTLNFEVVSVSSPDLFEIQPSVSQDGTLTFKTALHKNGTSLVVVQLVDDGVGTPPPNDNDSVLQTLTITLSPINDAPEFSIPGSLTVNEDAGLVSQSGFATNVLRGPAGTDDENIQQISFTATATDPTAFTTQPTIAPDGTLSFQTAPDVNSNNANLEVTVQLMDNGAASPPPNDNSSDVQTFTIIVNPVNDPPIPDEFTGTTDEDTAVTIDAADVLVGDAPGPGDESGQSLTMTQIERTSLNGGTVEPVFSGSEIVSFTYTPPANLVGDDSFLYVVTDDGSPARSGSGTIVINISGVNDAPEFIKGSDQIAPEDSATVTVENWATDILAGPANALDEIASQTVTFDVSVDNSGLFEDLPAVSSDGTLTFKPSTDANGTAVVTVVAVDNGASDAPNVNTSAPQAFTITISPVNDAPAFTSGSDVAVDEDSGAYSQPWATDIAAAAGLLTDPPTASDEAAQVVDFAVTNDLPALFTVQPSVSSDGQLEFTPAENAVGSAVVTVTAVDRGPADGQNVNTSAPQTFTITLNPINDPPLAVADNYNTDENSVLSVGAPGLLDNDTDVDLPGDSLSAVAATTTSSLGAVVVINEDGSFSYDPSGVASIQQMSNGQSVLDNFTYQIEDSEGLTSANNVSINVSGVDDPPVAVDDAYSMGVGQSRLLDVLTNDTDIDTAIDPRTITITSLPTSGSATVNQTGVIEYQAGAGFRGVDQLGYTVRDGAGNISNEAFVTITINNPPIAQDDSTFTFKNEPIIIDVLDNDSDPDGTIDPTTLQIVANPSPSGTAVVLDDGTVEFTPSTDFFGNVQFSYVVSDDVGTVSNVADVLVRVQRSRWQNPNGNLDVNADGFVTPIDALIVVNYLNGDNESFLPSTGIDPAPFLDPTGDESVTPLDALVIINFLNNNSGGGGAEGEADLGSQAYVMMVTPEQIIATVGEQVVRDIQDSLDQSMMDALGEDLDSAFIGPVLPGNGLLADGEGEEDDALFDSLTSSDKFAEDSMDEALAELFDEDDRMGPYRS